MAGLLDNVSLVCYVLDWLPASYLGPSLVLQVECLDSMPGPLVQHDDVTLLLTMSEVLKQRRGLSWRSVFLSALDVACPLRV